VVSLGVVLVIDVRIAAGCTARSATCVDSVGAVQSDLLQLAPDGRLAHGILPASVENGGIIIKQKSAVLMLALVVAICLAFTFVCIDDDGIERHYRRNVVWL